MAEEPQAKAKIHILKEAEKTFIEATDRLENSTTHEHGGCTRREGLP
jgi:hypothetical protein